ncbi:MAG: penicillin-binding protein 2 [Gammaproteobacteria bacterium]|nr:penicillin-binding protein 2 [Gammaproteobacteria bacterium]MBL7000448.1 penicillin-binding protein 2 [Gammaproteobacteria bacterium]
MAYREQLKDNFLETRLIQRRIVLSAVIVLILMSIILVRLYVLQVVEHDHFSTLSNSNRVRLKALPPTRGLIYDRNGVVLADNLPAYRLEIIREQVADLDDTLKRLSEYVEISDYAIKKFRQSSERRRPFEGIPLLLNLSDEELAKLAVNLHKFEGVEINARLTRNYPLGKHAVHALGYVGHIDVRDLSQLDDANYAGTSYIGKLGLEKYYESDLHGEVGFQRVEVNASGRTLRVLDEHPPVSGNNLHLTIDSSLQRLAEELFSDENGSVVAIDPRNGEILALVSMPSFDPNLFVDGISYKDYNELRDSSSRPLFNRALTGQYPPGSTTKPFFGLAGLENSVIGHKNTVFCGGYYLLPNEERKYRDWKKTGHGKMDLDDAITQSCDVYFYSLSYSLGIDRMAEFMQHFGFGERTGIDSTSEQPGLLPSREWKRRTKGMPWFPGETLITGIGQGALLTTPLQLANATGALAMKGRRFKPHLVSSINLQPSHKIVSVEPEIVGDYQLKKEINWQHIVRGMENVVHNVRGTAHRIEQGLSYRIAGKTGTAQVFSIAQDEEYDEETVRKKLRDHALFMAFAPADDPRIALAVIVENGGHGSSVAAPIARRLMDAYLLKTPKVDKIVDEKAL